MPLIVRSSHASMLVSCGLGAGDGAALLAAAAGLMVMREADFDSGLPASCDCGFPVCGDWVRGCGDGACGVAGFGDEVPDADGEPAASGPVEDGRGVEGPPSFARRFARICTRLPSACRLERELRGSCTLSASDMAVSVVSCSGGGGGGGRSVMSRSAMLGVLVGEQGFKSNK